MTPLPDTTNLQMEDSEYGKLQSQTGCANTRCGSCQSFQIVLRASAVDQTGVFKNAPEANLLRRGAREDRGTTRIQHSNRQTQRRDLQDNKDPKTAFRLVGLFEMWNTKFLFSKGTNEESTAHRVERDSFGTSGTTQRGDTSHSLSRSSKRSTPQRLSTAEQSDT